MKRRQNVVAIDARRLAGNRRGIGLQVYNLARLMPELAPEIEFLALLDRPLPDGAVPSGCRPVVVGGAQKSVSQSVSTLGSKVLSVYWMNVFVPRALRQHQVSLFHGINVAIPMTARLPRVATIHDLLSFRIPGTHYRLYEQYRRSLLPAVAQRAAGIVAVSESTRQDIVRFLGVPRERVTVIYPGVAETLGRVSNPETLASVRQQLGLPDSFILAVGAVERQKRLEPLIQAAAQVICRGLVEGVVLAGEEGIGADCVHRAVSESGLEGRVRILGYVAEETLAALYTLARCCVYPSWYEGFGVPVLEAMACATPVITTNASSLPEVAGDAALLVTPGDVNELTGALERVLSDDQLRAEMVAKGLARARQFSWRTTAARHVELYRRILEAPR